MPQHRNARWQGSCSKCGGPIIPGEPIVIYPEEGSGYSKKSHHDYVGCVMYTRERFDVDEERKGLEYMISCLRVLETFDERWALEELSKIAKADVSSSFHDDEFVELQALQILCERGRGAPDFLIPLIVDISNNASRDGIRQAAGDVLRRNRIYRSNY